MTPITRAAFFDELAKIADVSLQNVGEVGSNLPGAGGDISSALQYARAKKQAEDQKNQAAYDAAQAQAQQQQEAAAAKSQKGKKAQPPEQAP